MAFDPDAYLGGGGTATAEFNPDAYLGIEEKKKEFNPDEYLGAPPTGAPVALVPPEAQQALGTSAQAAFGAAGPVAEPYTQTPVGDLLQMQRLPEAAAAAQTEVTPQFDQYQVAQPDLQAIAMAQGAAMQPEAPPPPPRVEEIKATPTLFGELSRGNFRNAGAIATRALGRILEPAQPTAALQVHGQAGQSLLGTTEMLPPNPADGTLMRLGKATVNAGNRFMAGLTTPEMLPTLVLGGEPASGRAAAAIFAGDTIRNIPEIVKKIKESQDTAAWSQERWEAALDTSINAIFLRGMALHAIKGAPKPTAAKVADEVLPTIIKKGGEIDVERKAIEQQQQAAGAIQQQQQAAVEAIQGRAEGGPGGPQEIARGGGPGVQGPEGAPGRAAETGAGVLAPEDRRGPGGGPVGEPAAGLPAGGGPGETGGYGYAPTGEPIITAEPVTGAPVPPVIPESKGFIEAFSTAKDAATQSYADTIWEKIQKHEPIQRMAPLENRLRDLQKAGEVKSRDDVVRVIREVTGEVQPPPVAPPVAPAEPPRFAPPTAEPPVVSLAEPPTVPAELQNPRFRMLGSRARGDFTPRSDYDVVTKLTPEEYKTWISTPEGEYPRLPRDVINAVNGGHDVFIETEGGRAWKVEPHPVSSDPNHVVVERVSQIEKNLLAGGSKPIIAEPPVVSIAEPRPPTAQEKGKMYKTSKWTDVVEINSAQGNKIGKVNGNITDAGFEIKGANIIPGERGKGHYPEVLRQLAEKYGRVTSDPDGLSKAAEAAWKKVPGATKQGDVYTLEGAKTPEQMRAEAASAAAIARVKTGAARGFQIPHEPLGQPDIIDVITENGGIKSKPTAGDTASWNDQPDLRGVYRQLLGGSQAPDSMAGIAAEAGYGDGSVASFWNEVGKAIDGRRKARAANKAEVARQKLEVAQGKAFAKEAQRRTTKEQKFLNTANLQVGDTVTVKGETLKVTDIDPDTLDVTLEDGKKYGVQHVAENTAIYVDKADLVPREQDQPPPAKAPEITTAPGTDAELVADYKAAYAQHSEASRQLREATAKFRAGGDQKEFLAARKAFDQATKEFDAADAALKAAKVTPPAAQLSDAAQKVWDAARQMPDEFTAVDASHLSPAERRSLADRGLSFTEARDHAILATYPRRLRAEDLRAKVIGARKPPVAEAPALELASPESPEEQGARLQAEAAAKAQADQLQAEQDRAKYGFQQPLTGTTGDLGQMELGGPVPGPQAPELFSQAPPAEPPPPITGAMGAASVHEKLASYEMRGFAEKVQADNTVAQAVRDAVGNRYYEPIPNVRTAAEAEALVAARGPIESIKIITDQTNGLEYRHRVTMGMNVIRKLNAEYERLKETNPAAADKILDAQSALTESVQELGTGLAQGLQAFRMWAAMGPDGKLRALENQIRKVRAKFTAEHTEEITQILETVKQGGDTAKAKQDLIQKAADRIAKTLSDTPTYDKLTKGKKGNEALALIRAHLKEAQRDFVPKLVELGAKPDLALQIDRMAKDNRRRIEVASNVLGIQRREKAIDNIANRIARQLSDTPDFKGGNAGNVDPARELIRQHLKTPQPDFVDSLVKLGSTRKTAETIDRLSIENRKRILAVDHAERVRALEKLYSRTGNTVAKRIPKPLWSKIVDLADTGLLNNDSFYDLVAKKLGLPSLDQAGRRDLARMAQEIQAAPEGIPKDTLSLKFSKYIARNLGFPAKDLPLGIYYGNMLSGYNTHIVNSLDTFLNVASEIQTMAAANPKSASRIAYGALHGYLTGRHDFMLALSRGRMVTEGKWLEQPRFMEVAEFGKVGGVPIREGTRAGRLAKFLGERPIAYPLNAWKYVGRLLNASDALNYRAAEGARLALLNDRIARAEGLRGPALKARVDKLLGFTDEQMAGFREQATQEGFTGSAFKARVQELRRQVIREDARADAAEFAGIATYNHAPQGMLGYVARGMANAAEKYPILKLFVPFTNIVANVTNRGLNYTPLGYRRAFNLEFAKDADAKSAMLTRATLGTLGVGTLVAMQASGALQIHGNGPTDLDLRKQRMEGGWKPYSIQIGQHYFTYTYTPVGLFLSIIGNMTDAYRYKEMSQKDALTRGIFAVSRLGSTVFNQSFLSGLSNLFKGLSGAGGDVITAMRQTLSQSAGSLTTPSLIRDIQRWFDPKRYSSDTLMGDFLRNTPFAALANRPVLNAFGEAIAPPTNRFYSHISDDPAWQKVMKYDLKVPVPDKYTDMPDGKGGKRQITPEEYYRYQKMTGPIVKKLVMAMQFQNVPPDIGQKMLNEAAQTVRGAALEQLRLEALRHPAGSP